jgi:hypothetical protein
MILVVHANEPVLCRRRNCHWPAAGIFSPRSLRLVRQKEEGGESGTPRVHVKKEHAAPPPSRKKPRQEPAW